MTQSEWKVALNSAEAGIVSSQESLGKLRKKDPSSRSLIDELQATNLHIRNVLVLLKKLERGFE